MGGASQNTIRPLCNSSTVFSCPLHCSGWSDARRVELCRYVARSAPYRPVRAGTGLCSDRCGLDHLPSLGMYVCPSSVTKFVSMPSSTFGAARNGIDTSAHIPRLAAGRVPMRPSRNSVANSCKSCGRLPIIFPSTVIMATKFGVRAGIQPGVDNPCTFDRHATRTRIGQNRTDLYRG